MTGGNLLPMALLRRKAVVYVRQSTPQQVNGNLESQRRQYELVDVARRWGSVSYNNLRAHETGADLVCRLLREKKKTTEEK